MSNRELVINLVKRLPEGLSLPEIAREFEFLADIGAARQQACQGQGLPVKDARAHIRQWSLSVP